MDGVCVKIPEQRVKELLKKEGFAPFQPMGRKMREWVLIIHENLNDYLKDKDVFKNQSSMLQY